ncbi:MAG: FkbM family methyltransferase [Magnetococcales bacterium]|nr:FkbM family methyltransferase [Magnetococcales bacterium]
MAQIAPRLLDGNHLALKACRHGLMAYNKNDAFVGRALDLYGEWCEAEMALLGQILQPGQTVLDIGANIGTHTLFFSQQVTGKEQIGVVHAFEPQRLAYQMLCANLAINERLNVFTHQVAVGDAPGETLIPAIHPREKINFSGLPAIGYEQGETVSVVTIDGLNLPACHLIKIDVEGMESRVLNGARETIGRYRPVIYTENNTEERAAETIATMTSLNYRCWWHIEGYYNPNNHFNNEENIFQKYAPEANMLCFHQDLTINVDDSFPPVTGVDDNYLKALDRRMEALNPSP